MRMHPLIAVADGLGSPGEAPLEAIAAAGANSCRTLVGWMPVSVPWLDAALTAGGIALMAGGPLEPGIASGSFDYVPIRFAGIERILASSCRPDILVVRGRPSGTGFCFGTEVGWAFAAALATREVIVEVDESLPVVESPTIPGAIRRAAAVARPVPDSPQVAEPSEAERRIGELIAELLPDKATIQYGPGPLGRAVIEAITRPVAIRSGLVDEAVASLASRGLLTGQAVAGYLYGAGMLREFAASGGVRLAPGLETHGAAALGATRRFVALNAALQIGLDGAVNAEVIGGRRIAGVGGHPDFCGAAARAEDGLSIIAAPSTRRGRSTIVADLEAVTTPAGDVDIVVTEHGVADLRGLGLRARGRELVRVADPAARDELARRLAVVAA
jgi:acyl-CoA hydrolase